jgi:GNAT superfamily N-acetyltransferase
MTDLREYEDLARETDAYEDIELDILKEAMETSRRKPGDPYTLLEIRDGKILAGFALLCREAGSGHSFEVRSICVDPAYIGKGVAKALLDKLEEKALGGGDSAILRVEISSTKEKAIGEGVLSSGGYALIGHIPNFYSHDNDYFMYAKHLRPNGEEEKGTGKE